MKKMKFVLLAMCLMLFGAIVGCSGKNAKYSFETNCDVEITTQEVAFGEEYTLPVPTREGYEFLGWYEAEDFSGTPVVSVVASEDAKEVKYYAKWEQLYKITLELDGGSLSATTLYMRAGAVIADFMKDYVPTKSGYVFGAWYVGDTALTATAKMTESGITLTAKYKIGYTIETYLQTLDGTSYEKAEESLTEYDYVGVTVTPTPSITGYRQVASQNAVSSCTLTANASENVVKLYFDRENFSIFYHKNAPDGSVTEPTLVTVRYGEEVEALSDITVDGYALIGWSQSANGEIVYRTHYLENAVFNKGADVPTTDKIAPEGNLALYAVWSRGYTDMFFGNDYIYLDVTDNEVAYLCRGSVYFAGSYDTETSVFLFRDSENNIILRGKIVDTENYAYRSLERDGFASSLFVPGKGLDESVTIYFDQYNGITYSQLSQDGQTTVDSTGTYTIDEDYIYTAAFTEGALQGQSLVFTRGTLNGEPAFQLRNEEEYAMGPLTLTRVYDGSLVYYRAPYFQITMSGFSKATMHNGTQLVTYNYTYNKETGELTLRDTLLNRVAGVARVFQSNDTWMYTFYEEDYDRTYTAASGATITLDGTYNATYKDSSTEIEGYFETSSLTIYSGEKTLITFTYEEGTKYFLLAEETETEYDENGKEVTTQKYTFKTVANGYAEYRYSDDNKVFIYPLLILNDTAEGHASIYGYTSTKTYALLSEGTYVLDDNTGLYVYTALNTYEVEDLAETGAYDISQITSLVFNIDTGLSDYSLWYWHAYATEENENTSLEVETYTSKDGETLTFLSSFALYTTKDGETVVALYSASQDDESLYSLRSATGTLYVEVDVLTKSFFAYLTAPYTARDYETKSTSQTLAFDGKGGVTYTVKNGSETATYAGTYAETGKSEFGAIIYTFTQTDGDLTFKFIQISGQSVTYFARYSETYHGEYVSEDGVLSLDGYGYAASYLSVNGTVEGIYTVIEENLVYLETENEIFYFDLDGNNFTVRGKENGSYLIMDNQSLDGRVITLNGYGKLFVRVPNDREVNEDNEGYDTYEGVYEINGDEYVLIYTAGAEEVKLYGKLSYTQIGSTYYNTYVISHKDVISYYVNAVDWSLLILDGNGGAIKYSAEGVRETGQYILVTDSMLYYVNSNGSDACIYEYNVAKATATPKTFRQKVYYTDTLESLVFSQYGFAIFNGQTRYYYNEVNGEIVIYRKAVDSTENANRYGFVEEQFGELGTVKKYDGKTYYIHNGYAISFARVEETKNNYPVSFKVKDEGDEEYREERYALEELLFSPSGAESFRVTGKVYIKGTAYDCVVIRDGAETYLTITTNGGYFRFDLTLTYGGENEDGTSNSTYEVTRMRHIVSYNSYTYLSMYYFFYMYFGPSLAASMPNVYGTIDLVSEYDVAGDAGKEYLNATFGEYAGIYDLDGAITSLEEMEYEFDEENKIYTVAYQSEDGYSYTFYFLRYYFTQLKTNCYVLYAYTRTEVLETEDYTITAERILASDGLSVGGFYDISLKKGEEEIKWTAGYTRANGLIYYVVRETETDEETNAVTITSSIYYVINFEEETGSLEGSDEEENPVLKPYKSAAVEKRVMTVYYNEEGTAFIEVDENNNVLLIASGYSFLGESTVYDDTTGIYNVTIANGRAYFKITVSENKILDIELVIPELEEETEDKAE